MDVSIIIVTYNTKDITCDCISSIKENVKEVDYEIILVDNASTDGSRSLFEGMHDIQYYYLDYNIGFGNANNLGFSHAKGNYIFLLNSDTIMRNNAVLFFLNYARNHSGWGCLGSQLLNKDGGNSPSFGYFLTIRKAIVEALLSYVRIIKPMHPIVSRTSEIPYEVEVVIGADVFISRKTIEEYGLFDKRYFMYHEENDMMRTYHENGLKNYIIPGPEIIHLESQSTKISFNKKVMSTRSLFIYLNKWNNKYCYYFFRILFGALKLPYLFSRELDNNQRIQYFRLLTEPV